MLKRNLATLFDVSVCSTNLGDQIITEFVMKELNKLLLNHQITNVPTHDFIGLHAYKQILRSKFSIVGGSNLLSSNMPFYRQWKLKLFDPLIISNVILLGVGWWQYQESTNLYTKLALKNLLSKHNFHSVRDSYTQEMLNKIGIPNVLNTGCPTMWGLTPEHCFDIPSLKADNVVTTITDYNFDGEIEREFLELLLKNYKKVYVWLQGDNDRIRLQEIGMLSKLHVIPPSLSAYRNIIANRDLSLDYIGTRLHAGIYALNYKIRTLVLAIDNRAIEISKDTNLPSCSRKDVKYIQEWIYDNRKTTITLNLKNIELFRESISSLDKI